MSVIETIPVLRTKVSAQHEVPVAIVDAVFVSLHHDLPRNPRRRRRAVVRGRFVPCRRDLAQSRALFAELGPTGAFAWRRFSASSPQGTCTAVLGVVRVCHIEAGPATVLQLQLGAITRRLRLGVGQQYTGARCWSALLLDVCHNRW